jgi:DNA-binding NarL/FixJ family response regulator
MLEEWGQESVEPGYFLQADAMRAAMSGDMPAALANFERSAAIGAQYGDHDLLAMARQGHGRVLIRMGEVIAGVALLDEVMASLMSGEVSPLIMGGVYCSVIEGCHDMFDLRRAREWTEAPIIVLSARDLESEKIAALDLGADDFVNKPVGVGELLARVRASLRGRERRFSAQPSFTAGDLEINFLNRRVFVQNEEVRLTPREYDLLRTLARHAGRVVTHRQVIAAVCRPETWNSGLVTKMQVGCAGGASADGAGASIMPRRPEYIVSVTSAITLRWLCIAPFGRPVVPLV